MLKISQTKNRDCGNDFVHREGEIFDFYIQYGPWNSTLRLKIACERDFYVLRSHMDSTRFEPFNLTLNFRNHGYSTQCTIIMIPMYNNHDDVL